MDPPCPRGQVFSSLMLDVGGSQSQCRYGYHTLNPVWVLAFNYQGWLSLAGTRWIYCVFVNHCGGWMDGWIRRVSLDQIPRSPAGWIHLGPGDGVPVPGTLSSKLVESCLLLMENGSAFSIVFSRKLSWAGESTGSPRIERTLCLL